MTSKASKTDCPTGERALESPQRKVAIHTHGCKLNQSDSQSLARQFREAGYQIVEPSAGADVVVLNSCTVTATADAKARQFLRAARRRNPDAVVVATGCYAQRSPADLQRMTGVSLVIGNTGKSSLVEATGTALQAARLPSDPLPLPQPKTTRRTRAMVKIQEGCDQVCAYCIVPKVRGRERSIVIEEIVGEISRHVYEGYREVALTGTQLGTYGFDLPYSNLERLLEQILSETEIERLRVSSLQAHEISGSLLALWSDYRLMPHFHIPLQSGCDSTLSAMRRRYDTSRFAESVSLVRGMFPDAGITTDIIVGFPGESPEDFARSLDFAQRMEFSDIHVFPYSQRPGTSAVYLGRQVPESEKRRRMGETLALSAEAHRRFRQRQLGTERSVLWERSSGTENGLWSGLTDNYVRVKTAVESDLGNEITNARLTNIEDDWVLSEVVR